MAKLIAIVNVVAWSGFWAFGYLALTAAPADSQQIMVAMVLAALGAGLGLWAWFRLIRVTEKSGYARAANRADRSHLEEDYNGGTA